MQCESGGQRLDWFSSGRSPTSSRFVCAIPDGKPLRTFPGIALFALRNSGRKTVTHFSWNCF
ncbi:MAG: hypothetical protein E5X48_14130 [Mesorhizobium sp.]|nr:MAG: hypothetical protein E5X48_14130 [Mesorhizobium sp.]